MKRGIYILLAACLMFGACTDRNPLDTGSPDWGNNTPGGDDKPDPEPGPKPEPEYKEKMLWFDAQANFQRFAEKENIVHYLQKTKEAGFNKIVVDVRPVHGNVLYYSKIMPQMTKLDGITVERDWDYLQYFLDEAKKLDLKVTVSCTIFTGGRPSIREGMVYDDPKWDGKTCLLYTKDGMMDVRDDRTKVSAFLNPVLPEVREFAMSIIRELVTNYEFDALALDYCRFPGGDADFSAASHGAFQEYLGRGVGNFPADIFTYDEAGNMVPGPLYQDWWAFRARIIHDFVRDVKTEIKAIKPDIKLEYWAASWHHGLFLTGQNWAGKLYDPSLTYPWWASPDYKNAGFAEHLDTFLLGTYLSHIFGLDDPESIEYGIRRGDLIINNACKMYGTLYALNHKGKDMQDAVELCLTKTRGLMVFDIVQVIQFDTWDDIKKGIEAAEAKYN